MQNRKIILISVVVVLVALVFVAGNYYGKKSIPSESPNFANRAGMMGGGGATRNGVGRMSNGFVGGEVISKDDSGVVIKMRDGSSRIVFTSSKTVVSKSIPGALSDVAIGSDVTVTGSGNSDGSVTAQMIQIRPATSTGFR